MTFVPQTAPILGLPPDPFKHVHYTLGMVLGVDDFTQEFAYLSGHDQWLTRGVIGYGTVCGLRVTVEPSGSAGPQVVVTPGTAINPRGQLIRMDETKCARLNDWLLANREAVLQNVGSPPSGDVRLYVILCYRECEMDMVPIPGEPCRTEDDSMAASRLQDYHLLDLRFEPPDQRQFDATRDFVGWLRQIEVDSVADTPALREQFERAIREAIPQLMSPPQSPPTSPPDFMLGSPPSALAIPVDAVRDYLNLAFRLWVTEIRPLWLGKNESCAGQSPDEECVLLGEIVFPITADGQVAVDALGITVEEERRPFIVSLQMLQEWVLCGRAVGGSTTGADGASAEMRRLGNDIQWRQSDDSPTWTTLFSLDEISGGGGTPGAEGASVEMRVDSGFIQWRQSDDDPTWTPLLNLSDISGGGGTPGAEGASAEMRRLGNDIQWRQSDDSPTWTTLFSLDDISGGGGTPGAEGASVEMRVDSGFIQWRQSDDDPTWTPLLNLSDISGGGGTPGAEGASVEMRRLGNDIQWRQSDDSPTWTTLFSLDEIGGGGGIPGAEGASVEMRVDSSFIQWRQSDDNPTWTPLLNLSDISGTPGTPGIDGASVEMRIDVDSGFIQWRRSDDTPTWTNLVALANLRGPAGPEGPRGVRGAPGPASPGGTSFIVAAGRFNADASTVFEFNDMRAAQLNATLYFITFNDYKPENQYIIKGTVISTVDNPPHFFEVIEGEQARAIVEARFGANAVDSGFVVRVIGMNNEMSAIGFMIEVSQFGGG